MPGSNQHSPPKVDEAEISLFGPGFGECVVIHLGNSDWVVVDSFLDRTSRLPVALDYLGKLGVDCSTDVKLVVATHYHDDHMAGLGELFAACTSAKFVCSVALNCQEWATLVETYRAYSQPGGTGVDELRKVMHLLKQRTTASQIHSPQFALAKLPLFERTTQFTASVTALSPSSAAVALMQATIQNELLPRANQRKLRVRALDRNDGSVVLSVRVGKASALLGADLEERGQGGIGWQAVVDDHPAEAESFDAFKIPHHGSQNGFHPGQWSKLVSKTSVAALTPYNRGKKLPTVEDCNRILKQTKDAYITAPPGLGKFRHPDRTVQKTMTEATLVIGDEHFHQGHLRLRKRVSSVDSWQTELFGDAMPVSDLLNL